MLNQKEKKEILADAKSPQRREIFRKIRIEGAGQSFDAYLRFLSSVVKTFDGLSARVKNPAGNNFKL